MHSIMPRSRRINEVAREVGITARAIRYYEEIGLLAPSARSQGDQRLFDDHDVERLRAIVSMRDDAGFSLGDIAEVLADIDGRQTRRAAYRDATDPARRRAMVLDELTRVERHVSLLRGKIDRLASMVGDAEARRARCIEELASIDASVKDRRL